MLFELALKKAGLESGDVWFYGDNVKADVEGSAQVGINRSFRGKSRMIKVDL